MIHILITYADVVKEWNYEKNKNITPEDLLPGMSNVVWWKCSKCNYEWKTRINHRTKDGNKCPKCSKIEKYNKLLESKGTLREKNQKY